MSFSDNLNFKGHPLRNPFWRELEEEGNITFRDNYQLELKSEFFIDPNAKEIQFSQEFYLFIPESLQINPETYSSNQFYHDQLNLIRYKTPSLSLSELIDANNKSSPLYRMYSCEDKDFCLKEMMLYGNIYRTSLRFRIRRMLKELQDKKLQVKATRIEEDTHALISDVTAAKVAFLKTKTFLIDRFQQKRFADQLNYIDEFMTIVNEEYFTLLLRVVREQRDALLDATDAHLCKFLDEEENHRKKLNPAIPKGEMKESILYRQGLLEKFMLEALKLKNTRIEMKQQYGNIIGAAAAGVAMFVYMLLFLWQASTLVINSAPFVFFAVFFYILKDRIKEGTKLLYNRYINRWFPDFRTRIYDSNGIVIGLLSESFLFIPEKKLPPGFYDYRMANAEDKLEFHQPSETILQYKKEVKLYRSNGRLTELTTIFRYNIHHFLEKANDAIQPTLTLDPVTHTLDEQLLAKVYHLNLILKSNFLDAKRQWCEEVKTFMIVIDKKGIKRVEQISSQLKILPS